MLLRDHSVRRLIHTSPPWDVPQASPSVSTRHFEIVMPPLNPKLRLSTHFKSVLFSQIVPFHPYRTLFDPNTPPHLNPYSSYFLRIQFSSILMMQFAVPSFNHRSRCSEIVTNSFDMFQIRHQSSAVCLNSIQLPLNMSLSIAIQFNAPQIVSRCQLMSWNCPDRQ